MQTILVTTIAVVALLCSASPSGAKTRPPAPDSNFRAEPAGVDVGPKFDKAWGEWRKRVADKIDERYKLVLPALTGDPPAWTELMYCITEDGQVKIKILRAGPNQRYNRIIVAIVQWLDEDKALLRFPAGSRRKRVCIRALYLGPVRIHHGDFIGNRE
jgi:hypothetical protein